MTVTTTAIAASGRPVARGEYAPSGMYNEFGGVVKQTGTLVTPADELYLPSPWQYQQDDGDLVVAGSGPWFVSAVENYVDSRQRYEGTATYVVVDEAGTLKVADVHWIGRPAGLE